jgi:hypothetical protein
MLPEKQKNAYTEFYNAARNNAILEPKTTLMLHLASAMAIGAREEGLTDDEIGAVQSVVMAVSAGRVGAQFRDACALD